MSSIMCFLDIYMKETSGIDLAKQMREYGYAGEIIFTTTSTEFAMENYDVDARYYLVKPYSMDKVLQVHKRYQRLVEEKEKENKAHILLKNGASYEKVLFDDIEYIESNNTVLKIHLINEKIFSIWKIVGFGGETCNTAVPA